jgi:hypothetical protein
MKILVDLSNEEIKVTENIPMGKLVAVLQDALEDDWPRYTLIITTAEEWDAEMERYNSRPITDEYLKRNVLYTLD